MRTKVLHGAALSLAMAVMVAVSSGCGSMPVNGNHSSSNGTASTNSNTISSAAANAVISSANQVSSNSTMIQTSLGGFPFGQTPKELTAMLKEKHISLKPSSYGSPPESGDVSDGRVYESPGGNFNYETKDITFGFDAKGKETGLLTYTSTYSTDKGLRVGDTVAKMKQLYGTGYTRYDQSMYEFLYKQGNLYFLVNAYTTNSNFDLNKIHAWGIYSFNPCVDS